MLVFSKMKKKLQKQFFEMYDSIPDNLKQEFNRRRKEFVKQNSLKLWKKFLIDLYDKQSRSTPKHFHDYIKGVFRKMRNVDKGIIKKRSYYGKKKIKRKSNMVKEKLSQSLKNKCKKLKIRLTTKRGGKRVYKSSKVLKKQCEKAMKKKKIVKRKRKFGAARKGHRVIPPKSHFGRPYFGYTRGGSVRFGSRRPEFHYPEHILKGYNTAKTCKKYRFGSRRPEFHYPEHILKGYNTAKDCKKYRFGKPEKKKKIKENRFRNFKKHPLTDEEFQFINRYTPSLDTKKKAVKFIINSAKVGKRDLNTGKPLLTRKDRAYLMEHGYTSSMIDFENWCGLNTAQCVAGGLGISALAGGAVYGAGKLHDHMLRQREERNAIDADTRTFMGVQLEFGREKSKKKVNYRKKRIETDLRELRAHSRAKYIGASLAGFPNWIFLGMKGGTYSDAGRMDYFMAEASKKGVTMTKQDAKKYVKIMDKIVEKETLSPEDKNFVVKFKLTTKSQLNKAAWCLKNSGSCTGVKFVLEVAALVGLYWAFIGLIVGGMNLVARLVRYLYRRYHLSRGERAAIEGQRRRRRNQGNIQANADRIRDQISRGEIRDPDPSYMEQLVDSDEIYVPYARNISDETEKKYQEIDKNQNIPERFIDTISQLIMRDPVIASDGNTYERSTIEHWLHSHNTSPLTNLPLQNRNLIQNNSLRSEIDEFVHSEWNKLQERGSTQQVDETTIAEPDTLTDLVSVDEEPSTQLTQEQRREAAAAAALRRQGRIRFGKRKVTKKRKVKKRKVTKKRKVKKRKVTKRKVTKRKGTKKK